MICALAGCGARTPAQRANDSRPIMAAADKTVPGNVAPVVVAARPAPFVIDEPPGGAGAGALLPVVAARVFALGDTQLHHLWGKRSWAQSPFAEKQSVEVAVRPAALDDGADLLLAEFLRVRREKFGAHTLVFMGDAADVSCTQELGRFMGHMTIGGDAQFLAVTSNHDGFYVGNYTQKGDLDGKLALVSDMPDDWTRACADAPGRDDHRLTKGRAVARWSVALPPAPAWATHLAMGGADDPARYAEAWLAAVRPLGGGDAGARPAWAILLDTVDYRDFDVRRTRGAGTTGAISRAQLDFVDRAMFEAKVAAGQTPAWIAFGHHPFAELDPRTREGVLRFLVLHPEVIAYVSAHTHLSDERQIVLADGRVVPELVVGSTTDSPQAARVIELRTAADGSAPAIASLRARLDAEALCEGIPEFEPDSLGYVGYRMVRDDTPGLSLGTWKKLMVWMQLDSLTSERVTQAMGALMVENELVRATAKLYLGAPGLVLSPAERARLETLVARRFPHAEQVSELDEQLSDKRVDATLDDWERWVDPVLTPAIPRASRALYAFAGERALFEKLRARRTASPELARWFACHAVRASEAEARRPKRQGDVVYVR